MYSSELGYKLFSTVSTHSNLQRRGTAHLSSLFFPFNEMDNYVYIFAMNLTLLHILILKHGKKIILENKDGPTWTPRSFLSFKPSSLSLLLIFYFFGN